MKRRTFLGAFSGTSLGVLLEGSFTELARAQGQAQPGAKSGSQVPFEASQIEVSGNTTFIRRYGKGPAILMVHGFPRTSLMWRFLAPMLAQNHTVVCVDLRAYGQSGIPASTDDHFPYSKRAMAKELVEVMTKLGFPTFTLIGHDRGGRVSYRLALDHPQSVERLAVFDVIPILEACLFCPDDHGIAGNKPPKPGAVHALFGRLALGPEPFETPLSGMSMNPARTLGPAAFAGYWHALWIYFVAPTVGMLAAGAVFLRARHGRPPFCAKLHHANNKRCIFRHGS